MVLDHSLISFSSSRGDPALHASLIQVETPRRGRMKRISTNQPTNSRMIKIKYTHKYLHNQSFLFLV
jgi:hypothetical protein